MPTLTLRAQRDGFPTDGGSAFEVVLVDCVLKYNGAVELVIETTDGTVAMESPLPPPFSSGDATGELAPRSVESDLQPPLSTWVTIVNSRIEVAGGWAVRTTTPSTSNASDANPAPAEPGSFVLWTRALLSRVHVNISDSVIQCVGRDDMAAGWSAGMLAGYATFFSMHHADGNRGGYRDVSITVRRSNITVLATSTYALAFFFVSGSANGALSIEDVTVQIVQQSVIRVDVVAAATKSANHGRAMVFSGYDVRRLARWSWTLAGNDSAITVSGDESAAVLTFEDLSSPVAAASVLTQCTSSRFSVVDGARVQTLGRRGAATNLFWSSGRRQLFLSDIVIRVVGSSGPRLVAVSLNQAAAINVGFVSDVEVVLVNATVHIDQFAEFWASNTAAEPVASASAILPLVGNVIAFVSAYDAAVRLRVKRLLVHVAHDSSLTAMTSGFSQSDATNVQLMAWSQGGFASCSVELVDAVVIVSHALLIAVAAPVQVLRTPAPKARNVFVLSATINSRVLAFLSVDNAHFILQFSEAANHRVMSYGASATNALVASTGVALLSGAHICAVNLTTTRITAFGADAIENWLSVRQKAEAMGDRREQSSSSFCSGLSVVDAPQCSTSDATSSASATGELDMETNDAPRDRIMIVRLFNDGVHTAAVPSEWIHSSLFDEATFPNSTLGRAWWTESRMTAWTLPPRTAFQEIDQAINIAFWSGDRMDVSGGSFMIVSVPASPCETTPPSRPLLVASMKHTPLSSMLVATSQDTAINAALWSRTSCHVNGYSIFVRIRAVLSAQALSGMSFALNVGVFAETRGVNMSQSVIHVVGGAALRTSVEGDPPARHLGCACNLCVIGGLVLPENGIVDVVLDRLHIFISEQATLDATTSSSQVAAFSGNLLLMSATYGSGGGNTLVVSRTFVLVDAEASLRATTLPPFAAGTPPVVMPQQPNGAPFPSGNIVFASVNGGNPPRVTTASVTQTAIIVGDRVTLEVIAATARTNEAVNVGFIGFRGLSLDTVVVSVQGGAWLTAEGGPAGVGLAGNVVALAPQVGAITVVESVFLIANLDSTDAKRRLNDAIQALRMVDIPASQPIRNFTAHEIVVALLWFSYRDVGAVERNLVTFSLLEDAVPIASRMLSTGVVSDDAKSPLQEGGGQCDLADLPISHVGDVGLRRVRGIVRDAASAAAADPLATLLLTARSEPAESLRHGVANETEIISGTFFLQKEADTDRRRTQLLARTQTDAVATNLALRTMIAPYQVFFCMLQNTVLAVTDAGLYALSLTGHAGNVELSSDGVTFVGGEDAVSSWGNPNLPRGSRVACQGRFGCPNVTSLQDKSESTSGGDAADPPPQASASVGLSLMLVTQGSDVFATSSGGGIVANLAFSANVYRMPDAPGVVFLHRAVVVVADATIRAVARSVPTTEVSAGNIVFIALSSGSGGRSSGSVTLLEDSTLVVFRSTLRSRVQPAGQAANVLWISHGVNGFGRDSMKLSDVAVAIAASTLLAEQNVPTPSSVVGSAWWSLGNVLSYASMSVEFRRVTIWVQHDATLVAFAAGGSTAANILFESEGRPAFVASDVAIDVVSSRMNATSINGRAMNIALSNLRGAMSISRVTIQARQACVLSSRSLGVGDAANILVACNRKRYPDESAFLSARELRIVVAEGSYLISISRNGTVTANVLLFASAYGSGGGAQVSLTNATILVVNNSAIIAESTTHRQQATEQYVPAFSAGIAALTFRGSDSSSSVLFSNVTILMANRSTLVAASDRSTQSHAYALTFLSNGRFVEISNFKLVIHHASRVIALSTIQPAAVISLGLMVSRVSLRHSQIVVAQGSIIAASMHTNLEPTTAITDVSAGSASASSTITVDAFVVVAALTLVGFDSVAMDDCNITIAESVVRASQESFRGALGRLDADAMIRRRDVLGTEMDAQVVDPSEAAAFPGTLISRRQEDVVLAAALVIDDALALAARLPSPPTPRPTSSSRGMSQMGGNGDNDDWHPLPSDMVIVDDLADMLTVFSSAARLDDQVKTAGPFKRSNLVTCFATVLSLIAMQGPAEVAGHSSYSIVDSYVTARTDSVLQASTAAVVTLLTSPLQFLLDQQTHTVWRDVTLTVSGSQLSATALFRNAAIGFHTAETRGSYALGVATWLRFRASIVNGTKLTVSPSVANFAAPQDEGGISAQSTPQPQRWAGGLAVPEHLDPNILTGDRYGGCLGVRSRQNSGYDTTRAVVTNSTVYISGSSLLMQSAEPRAVLHALSAYSDDGTTVTGLRIVMVRSVVSLWPGNLSRLSSLADSYIPAERLNVASLVMFCSFLSVDDIAWSNRNLRRRIDGVNISLLNVRVSVATFSSRRGGVLGTSSPRLLSADDSANAVNEAVSSSPGGGEGEESDDDDATLRGITQRLGGPFVLQLFSSRGHQDVFRMNVQLCASRIDVHVVAAAIASFSTSTTESLKIMILRDLSVPSWVITTTTRSVISSIERVKFMSNGNSYTIPPQQCVSVAVLGSVVLAPTAMDCLSMPPLDGDVCSGSADNVFDHADIACRSVGWSRPIPVVVVVPQGGAASSTGHLLRPTKVQRDAVSVNGTELTTQEIAAGLFPNAELQALVSIPGRESSDFGAVVSQLALFELPCELEAKVNGTFSNQSCGAGVASDRYRDVEDECRAALGLTTSPQEEDEAALRRHLGRSTTERWWSMELLVAARRVDDDDVMRWVCRVPVVQDSIQRSRSATTSLSPSIRASPVAQAVALSRTANREPPPLSTDIGEAEGRSASIKQKTSRTVLPVVNAPLLLSHRSRTASVRFEAPSPSTLKANASGVNGSSLPLRDMLLVEQQRVGSSRPLYIASQVAVGGVAAVALLTASAPFMANRATSAGRIAGMGKRCRQSADDDITASGAASPVPDQISFVWVPSPRREGVDDGGGPPSNVAEMVQVAIASTVGLQATLLCVVGCAWVLGWSKMSTVSTTITPSPLFRARWRTLIAGARVAFSVALNYYAPNVVGLCVAALSAGTTSSATRIVAVLGLMSEVALATLCAVVILRTGREVVESSSNGQIQKSSYDEPRLTLKGTTLAACLVRPMFDECRTRDLDRVFFWCSGGTAATTKEDSNNNTLPHVTSTPSSNDGDTTVPVVPPNGVGHARSTAAPLVVIPNAIILYGVIDLAVAFAVAVLSSAPFPSGIFCSLGVFTLFVVSALHVAYLLAVRPQSTDPSSVRTTIMASVLTAANAVFALGLFSLLVTQPSSSSSTVMDTYLNGFAIVLIVLFYGQAAVELAMAIRKVWLNRIGTLQGFNSPSRITAAPGGEGSSAQLLPLLAIPDTESHVLVEPAPGDTPAVNPLRRPPDPG